MNSYISIGEIIKYYRQKSNISQANLAEGICTREYIGKIERNECCPTIDIINQLSSRLGVNLYDNYALILDHHDLKTHSQIVQLNEAISKRDFEELKHLVDTYIRLPSFSSGIPYQYIQYSQALYSSMILGDYKLATKYAMDGLHSKYTNILDLPPTDVTLSKADLLLTQTIAVNLCRQNFLDIGRRYFSFLIAHLSHICSLDHYFVNRNKRFELNLYAHVVYNNFIFLPNDTKTHLDSIDTILQLLRKHNFSNMLPELLLCKACLNYISNDYKTAVDNYLVAHYTGTFLYSSKVMANKEQEILGDYYEFFTKNSYTNND